MQSPRRETVSRSSMTEFGLAGNSKYAQVRSMLETRPVFDTVEAWMRFFGYPRKDIFAFRLALEEAVANALQHGNGGDRAKYVQITYAVLNDEAIAQVSDEGSGFDPQQVPDPLAGGKFVRAVGLGLFLMRAYTSWVSYNRQGNCVTLCRYRSKS